MAIDNFFYFYQHDDNIEYIVKTIRLDKFQICEVCKQEEHDARRCPQTKIAFQKRGLCQAYKPRKESQLGAYANSEPFDKLTDVMIPHEFFHS